MWCCGIGKKNNMLDFYIIADDQPRPANIEVLEYAGGLDSDVFKRLQNKGIIDQRFNYYSDFRWGTDIIVQISRAVTIKKIESDTDVSQLLTLLNIAQARNSGLMAFGD